MTKPLKIVVCALNIKNGGALTILNDLVYTLESFGDIFSDIYVISSTRDASYGPKVTVKHIPIKNFAFVQRIFYSLFGLYFLSNKLRPHIWISLHNIYENVVADRKYVYCHNAIPFSDKSMFFFIRDLNSYIHKHLYNFIYCLNCKFADFVVVQQEWLRDIMLRKYHAKNVIVSYPVVEYELQLNSSRPICNSDSINFIYPSLPRVWKNFEVIFAAATYLDSINVDSIRIHLTVIPGSNKYIDSLVKKYGIPNCIVFHGHVSKSQVHDLYSNMQWLLFPSFIESWGLPISEAKLHKLNLCLADLPYAREAQGGYETCVYFDPNSSQDLVKRLLEIVGNSIFARHSTNANIGRYVLQDWHDFVKFVISH